MFALEEGNNASILADLGDPVVEQVTETTEQQNGQTQEIKLESSDSPAPLLHAVKEDPDAKAIVPVPPTGDAPPASNASLREGFGCVVYVTGLDWWITDVDLERACQEFGTVCSMKFFEDRSNGRSMGSSAVEFKTDAEAKACIEKLNATKVGDKEVSVAWPGKGRFYKPRCVTLGARDCIKLLESSRMWPMKFLGSFLISNTHQT